MARDKLWGRLERDARTGADDFRGIMTFHLVDLRGGRRMDINGDQVLAAGSAIKIPVLMHLYHRAFRGDIDLDAPHTVRDRDIVGGSGVLQHLEGDVRLSLRDLAILMINVSDNVATNICIDRAGMDDVNCLLRELGCEESRLQRKMIDADAVRRGRENISTAQEMARWLEVLHTGEWENPSLCQDVLSVLRKRKDSPIRRAIPADIPVAGKTGGLPGVRCEVAIIEQEHRPYVLAVMTAFGVDDDNSEAITGIAATVQAYLEVLDDFTEYGRGLNPR